MNTSELEEDKIIQINMPFQLSKLSSIDPKKIHNVLKFLKPTRIYANTRIY